MNNYPSLAELYERRRYDNQLLRRERIDDIYKKCPTLESIDLQLRALSLKKGRNRLNPNASLDTTDFAQKEQQLLKEKNQLLQLHNIPEDYLEEIYTCKLCNDNGSINGEYCSCYTQEKANLLFEHSPIFKQMEKENFDTFDFSLYSNQPFVGSSMSPRENIELVYEHAKQFVANFPNCKNLLLQGTTGVGKTFLTNCIAKELIGRCVSVCYLSATKFFDILAAHAFSKDNSAEAKEQYQLIQDCELLIIDDLGTELHNSFVDSILFEIINDRHKKDLRILISTNLDMKRFGDTYSKRTLSRITEQFDVVPIFGADIRMLKNR